MSTQCYRPPFDGAQSSDFLEKYYGLSGLLEPLPGERDLNFKLDDGEGKWVFKIANRDEDTTMLECQDHVFSCLKSAAVECVPEVKASLTGKKIEQIEDSEGHRYDCRVVSYLEGRLLSEINPATAALRKSLGSAVASVTKALQGFEHPALERPLLWKMEHAGEIVNRYVDLIEQPERRALLHRYTDRYENSLASGGDRIRRGVIHNDANDNNVLVESRGPWEQRVAGLIDYGDMVYGWLVTDAAVAAAYAILDTPRPLDAAGEVIAGFHTEMPLTEHEIDVVFDLMVMRLCMSVCISAYQQQQEPNNKYLAISEAPAWRALLRLADIHPRYARYYLRSVCGLEPVPNSTEITAWCRRNHSGFSSIVDLDLKADRLLPLDSSVSSPFIGNPAIPYDSAIATRDLFRQIDDQHCDAGIGMYCEYRLIYASDDFDDATGHRRTLHLGIDIFQPAGSPVYACYEGCVWSVAYHDAQFDYGGTVILQHNVELSHGEVTFFTLYGHLTPQSFRHLIKGQHVSAGTLLATMGEPSENGDWPPHVHFEIVTDLLDEEDTFVGVGSHGHRDVWRSLCPDPNAILQIPQDLIDRQPVVSAEDVNRVLNSRRAHLSPNLRLSYRDPIYVARGALQYLYDYTGRPYLDGVNNVAHVGHCHPAVVEAECRQSAVLNTNSRYLYPQIEHYSERLLSFLPQSLDVVFLVNSGSEANDLALRLAHTYTGRKDVLIVDHAYHGHLQSLISISPYKHNGPGGEGRPVYTHTVPMPDRYRDGIDDEQSNRRTVETIEKFLQTDGLEPSAFIAESVLGCGGQVVLPDGFLQAVYDKARNVGAVCIADEVQVGFGRVGSHFWGFEAQDVVPDIVTLGKPIGNGHPLAAVVTTRAIADAFNNGMEYFNTFGGNPVSCAVGHAVLDVIESENLQHHAHQCGGSLIKGLQALQEDFSLIGEVRGLGLFVGIELVLDIETKVPAPAQAAYIAERMKQSGILISTDGPNHNVLKIKPPLCFSQSNADQLVSTLASILCEDYARPTTPVSMQI
ncbi:MAG: aminotransferase class III-fold pyridoxal phosphate-dependent enzyme [Pseudomonadota bacterium]